MMAAGRGSLPYDAQVEYLKSNGTQYIDTGIIGDMYVDFEIKFKIDNENDFYGILGSRQASNQRRYTLITATSAYPNQGAYITMYTNSQITTTGTYKALTYKTYKKDGRKVYVNGNDVGTFSQYYTFTTPDNLKLFAISTNGVIGNNMVGEIAWCKLSKDGTMLRDFIPVRVGTTGYMYDKVSRQLFGNSGTGDFVIGNDI